MNVRKMALMLAVCAAPVLLVGCGEQEDDAIVLRVSNWEEYIDQGDWDEEELIDLEDGTEILGENSMVEDFEEWYEETYGKKIRVEYSTFGTNEELYNQLTIGDTYDLACPSEYMIMKMQREGLLLPFSEEFYDKEIEENYYAKGVSPYIKDVFDHLDVNGEPLSTYGAGYMWGTLGLVYNPELVDEEDVRHWDLLINPDYAKRVTIKDSVRDAYFGAMGILYYDEIMTDEFTQAEDYHDRLSEKLNLTDPWTVDQIENVLSRAKDNVYAFETDSGKADMVTGKVIANMQWSGDAVYTMDQADEDEVELCYSAPEEGTNLWFDGWVLLRKGVEGDTEKQQAAEAFVNFVSRPDNAIRNMYYIGYTSVVSGGDSDLIYEYLDWNYGAEADEMNEGEDAEGSEDADHTEYADSEEDADETEEALVEYPVGYFFAYGEEDCDDRYTLTTTEDQTRRQLFAQYPPKDVVDRSVVMACFPEEDNARINRMWTNVRCFDPASLFR